MMPAAFRLAAPALVLAGAAIAQETPPVEEAPAAAASEAEAAAEAAPTPESFRFAGAMASTWEKPTAEAIVQDAPVTLPLMIHDRDFFDEGVYVWDAWPLRNLDGSVAEIEGWTVLVGLSSEWEEVEETGHAFFTLSELRYWYSRDGEWRPGGLVFPREEGLGSRQWAGSAFYDAENRTVAFYYTAVGDPEAASIEEDEAPVPVSIFNEAIGRPSTVQRLAAVEASVAASPDGIAFEDFGPHEILLEPDGFWYDTHETYLASEAIYGFRDPEYWRDPETGAEHILFTANAGGVAGPYNGVVGIATRQEDGDWALEPPILVSMGVNSQLERPHVVTRDGAHYLFFSTHDFTFAEDVPAPRGLYGFLAPNGDIRGRLTPLNGHGLVAANPFEAPEQVYSFLVLPDGHVMSYLNLVWGFDLRPEYEDLEFVGAPAPMFRLGFDGETVTVAGAEN